MQFIWISFQMLEHQVARVVEDSTSGFGQRSHSQVPSDAHGTRRRWDTCMFVSIEPMHAC
jgi:hypothetical protein